MPVRKPVGTLMRCLKCHHEWKNKVKTVKKCPNCKNVYRHSLIVPDLDGEEWRGSGISTDYDISNYGRLKRTTPGRATCVGNLATGTVNHDGYLRYNINGKGVFAHVLVAKMFIGEPPQGHECNHKDGVKLHNHFLNLEYVTHAENMTHAADNDLLRFGEESPLSRLHESDIQQMLFLKENGSKHLPISKMFNIDLSTVSKIVNGHSWKRTVEKYATQDL